MARDPSTTGTRSARTSACGSAEAPSRGRARPASARHRQRFAVFGLAAAAAFVLAGCESTNGLLGGTPDATVAQAPPPAVKTKTVAVYPVLAAPDPLNKQIQAEVAQSLDKSKFSAITVTDGTTPAADYQLRGFATASKDKAAAKLAYFFDVLDGQGQKLNRIAGDEALAKPATSKDVWRSVTPEIVKSVANRTATAFTASVGAAPVAPTQVAPAQVVAQTPPAAGAAKPTPIAVSPAETPAAKAATTGPTSVSVAPVAGAPGDGGPALTTALKSELKKKGLTVVDNGPATYRVHGQVTTAPTDSGMEQVKIAWDVKDASGNRMATVSQGNTVEKGALNGPWGATAGDIAAAATAAILPIIQKPADPSPNAPGKQAAIATGQLQ